MVRPMEDTLEIEQALIACQCCGHGFWFEMEKVKMACPYCGCWNYRQTVMRVLKGEEDEI